MHSVNELSHLDLSTGTLYRFRMWVSPLITTARERFCIQKLYSVSSAGKTCLNTHRAHAVQRCCSERFSATPQYSTTLQEGSLVRKVTWGSLCLRWPHRSSPPLAEGREADYAARNKPDHRLGQGHIWMKWRETVSVLRRFFCIIKRNKLVHFLAKYYEMKQSYLVQHF